MPHAANAFNFGTIADVLITIEYTALDSPTYRQQVIQQRRGKRQRDAPQFGSRVTAERPPDPYSCLLVPIRCPLPGGAPASGSFLTHFRMLAHTLITQLVKASFRVIDRFSLGQE
jgi:hypothetical protein